MASTYVTSPDVEWTGPWRSSMQRTVTNRIRVQTELGPDDRPRAVTVFAVLVVLAGIGFVMTRATFDRAREDDAPSETSGARAARAHEEARAPVAETPTPEAPAPEAPDARIAVQVPAAPDASVAPEAPPVVANARARTLTRGRVAYIRCEGVPQRAGPSPCPRDVNVERTVWTAIDRLPTCPALLGRRGAADVRVVFESGVFSGLGFRDLGGGELDRDAVRGCLEPALAGLRTELPAARMTASFRIDVE